MLAEGVFQVPLKTFVVSLLLSRGLRYLLEGILAIRYGEGVLLFLLAHKIGFALSVVGILLFIYLGQPLTFPPPGKRDGGGGSRLGDAGERLKPNQDQCQDQRTDQEELTAETQRAQRSAGPGSMGRRCQETAPGTVYRAPTNNKATEAGQS